MPTRVMNVDRLRQKLAVISASDRRVARVEVRRSAVTIETGSKRRAPVDTGRLRNSVTHVIERHGLRAVNGTNIEYGPHVEFGTRAHVIEPKEPGGVLVFRGNARQSIKTRRVTTTAVFATSVRHPGTRAQPFVFPPFEEERHKFVPRLAAALNESRRRATG